MPTDALRHSTTTPTSTPTCTPTTASIGSGSLRTRLGGAALLSALIVTGVALPVEAQSSARPLAGEPGSAAATFDRHVASFPDEIGANVGGVAARLHVDGEVAVPGDLFALFASDGSDDHTRLYDATAYTLVRSDVHPEMVASSETAAAVVGDILGREVASHEFTSAPAGGYSAGLTFAIGHLNEISGGAFTGDLSVASTGALDDDGYVDWVTAIDEKTAAAHLAGVDVMFTSAAPAFFTVDSYGSRFEGELLRPRHTGTPLAAERNWSGYELLGTERPVVGMDIVAVAHLGDVAAYLCGAGSDFACEVEAEMAGITIGSVATTDEPAVALEQRATASTDSVPPVGGSAAL